MWTFLQMRIFVFAKITDADIEYADKDKHLHRALHITYKLKRPITLHSRCSYIILCIKSTGFALLSITESPAPYWAQVACEGLNGSQSPASACAISAINLAAPFQSSACSLPSASSWRPWMQNWCLVVSCRSRCGGTQNLTFMARRWGPWPVPPVASGLRRFTHNSSFLPSVYFRPKQSDSFAIPSFSHTQN